MKISINNRWAIIIAAFLAINMFNIPFAGHTSLVDKGPTWFGLDVSWQMTTSYAYLHHWTWGKDIIYTYGPLAFLSTRIGWGIPAWVFLLFDVFIIINFFFVYKDIITRSANKWLGILCAFGITLMVGMGQGSDLSWLLLFFIIFWLYKISLRPNVLSFVMLFILITLSFYIKVNSGLFGLFFLAGLLLVNVLTQKQNLLAALSLLALPVVFIIITGQLLNVSLVEYFTTALEMIKGYNEIMYLDQHLRLQVIILNSLFFMFCFLSIRYMVKSLRAKDYNTAYFSLLIFGFVFLLRKQSVVRDDIQHMSEFIGYAPLMLFYGGFADKQQLFKKLQVFSIVSIVLSFIGGYEARPFTMVLARRYTYLPTYIQEIANYDPNDYGKLKYLRNIPARDLAMIGNAPIDVFPWDAEYLIENHLNYRPRPIFQSYSAYTAPLAEANYLAYQQHPPSFILFDYDTIDGRYALNDDPLVSLFLTRNYTVADTFTSNERWRILLKKKDTLHRIHLELAAKNVMDSESEIPISKAKYLRIKLKPSLLNTVLTFINKPEPLSIGYKTAAGEWLYARISPEMLQSGVLVEKMINNNHDFAQYLQYPDSLADVAAIKMQYAPHSYQNKMEVTMYEIK